MRVCASLEVISFLDVNVDHVSKQCWLGKLTARCVRDCSTFRQILTQLIALLAPLVPFGAFELSTVFGRQPGESLLLSQMVFYSSPHQRQQEQFCLHGKCITIVSLSNKSDFIKLSRISSFV